MKNRKAVKIDVCVFEVNSELLQQEDPSNLPLFWEVPPKSLTGPYSYYFCRRFRRYVILSSFGSSFGRHFFNSVYPQSTVVCVFLV